MRHLLIATDFTASLSPVSSPVPALLNATPISTSPTPQPPACISPTVAGVSTSQPLLLETPPVITSSAKIQQPVTFQSNPSALTVPSSTPSTLAVPNVVGRTQAVAASKRAFLQVIF